MNTIRIFLYCGFLSLWLALPLVSCAQKPAEGPAGAAETIPAPLAPPASPSVSQESSDYSCAYFYFLWGTHAENNNQFADALDAYEKALICDQGADYIKRKIPILHIKMGNMEQALDLLTHTVAEFPQDAGQRALLARLYVQQKKEDKAIEQYQAILSSEPENEQVILQLGALLSQMGRYEEARRQFEKLLEMEQEVYFSRLYLARIADLQDDYLEAETQYRLALELNWSADLSYELAELYLKNEHYQQAVDILRLVLKQEEKAERARLLITQALLAMGLEEEAIAELSLAMDSSNTPERISLVLSRLYLRNGNYAKAEEHLLAVLDQQESTEASSLLALIYLETGEIQRALDILAEINPTQEGFEEAVFLRTKILSENDRAAEARTMIMNLLEGEETRRALFFVLAASLNGEEEHQGRALEILTRGLAHYPDDVRLLFEYGMQLEKSGRLEEAIGTMEEILLLDPEHAEALNFVGYSWADTDQNLDKALAYIEQAMKLKPDNGYIMDSLGWVHYKLGNLEQAREELAAALRLVPDDPNILEHLGDVYLALGKVEQARTTYLSALEKYEDQQKKDALQQKIDRLQR